MRLQEDINFTTLNWVKPELDETLRQARFAIEAFVEDSTDASQMRACAAYLHQVHGTLRMVELYGAAMVAEEMEQLALSLLESSVTERDEAFTVLMRGIVQLPDYLERLQSGLKDIPVVLLPLLNELRAARGERGLSEAVLFSPDLSRPLPAAVSGPTVELPQDQLRAKAEALRSRFQASLLRWLRDEGNPELIAALTQVCDGLVAMTRSEHARRLFWVAGGTLEALQAGAFEASKPLKRSLARVEREIKRLADAGDAAFSKDPPLELTRQLLYFVAHAPTDYGRIREMRDVFGLQADLPTEAEIAHAKGSMTGHNRALLDTVCGAIKEDLLRVKDMLDLHMRSPSNPVSALNAQAEVLDRVADTLGMLGLGVPRRVVQEQSQAIAEVVGGNRPADEATLLDIAGALLYVEASLDDQVSRLGQASIDTGSSGDRTLPGSEAQHLLDAVVKEAIANFAQARQSFVAFIETNWDSAQLSDVPRLLDEVAGALRILELSEVAQLMTAVGRFTQNELIVLRRVPDAAQIDTFAEAVAALEYFLEALRDHRPGRETILEHARQGMEQLGYWPLPAMIQSESQEPAAATTTAAVPAAFDSEETGGAVQPDLADASVALAGSGDLAISLPEVASDAREFASNSASAEAASVVVPSSAVGKLIGFESATDDIDDEIREVFLEEFQEEVQNLQQTLPAWRANPEALDVLRSIRRVFHTLKGSGRLVGAMSLGEFSWRVENMLNRVLEGSREASPAVMAILDAACQALPHMHEALRTGAASVAIDIEAIKSVADRIAAGEEAWLQAPEGDVQAAAPAGIAAHAPDDSVHAEVDEVPAQPLQPDEREAARAAQSDDGATQTRVAVQPIDTVLFEILKAEVAGHLNTIDEWLDAANGRGFAATDQLLRAMHTISGAFAMTEVPAITEVTGPMESYIKRLLAHKRIASAQGVGLIADAASAIRSVMHALETPQNGLPDFAPLAARVRAERDTLPEPTMPSVEAHVFAVDDEADSAGSLVAVTLDAPDISGLPSFVDSDAIDAPIEAAAAEAAAADAAAADAAAAEAAAAEAAAADAAAAEAVAEAVAAEAAAAEAADAAAAEAAAADAAAAEAATAEAAAAEAAAAEAAAAEAAAAEAAAAEVAAAEVAAAEAAAADAAAADAAAAEAAAAEAAAAEAAAAEAAAAEAAAAEAVAAEATAIESATPDSAAPSTTALIEDEPDPEVPLDLSDLDEELLDIFIEESTDLLDHSDTLLTQLRENLSEREPVVGLQRDLHTLKGGARMSGIAEMGDLGHVMESLLEAVAEGRFDLGLPGLVLLERGFDRLHGMLSRITARQAIAMPVNLIARFEAASTGKFESSEPAVAPVIDKAAPTKPKRDIAQTVVAKPGKTHPGGRLSAPIETDFDDADDMHVRAPQEQVRIRADLLDRLVNYAGEVAIYRARLEQQLASFRTNLGELDQTTSRLRDQLRKLEIETEAQIIARFQREPDMADETFDPLELDRFSTLQQLTRALSESAADLTNLEQVLDDLTRQHETLLLQQSRVSSDLQEGLMRTRMVPFDSLVPRLRRILRQAGSETGKSVQLKVDGAQGEMDRSVLERITAPLEHMLRNSVAHGVESPADRAKVGKPGDGLVRIAVSREGSEVVIAVSDDGRGLDAAAIRAKAIERGLLAADAEVPDAELYGFILQTGFSTAESVSKLAGRGVGMDVVHSEIRQLGGTLGIRSRAGKGTEFLIRLPFTLAVTQAVFVKIGETSFAVPIASVAGVGRIDRDELEMGQLRGDALYRYAGDDYPVHDLGMLIGHAPAKAAESLQMPLLLARSGELRAAIAVDQVLGSREIVVKPVGPQVSSLPGIFGATVMGDGSVVVILDVLPLVRRHLSHVDSAETLLEPRAAVRPVARVPLVMVVDDSITMRKVSSRVLERQNYEVTNWPLTCATMRVFAIFRSS
ncbi:MAG: hybrid sensor histidine kinase/response regulator [Gammaproteobacteria bacterium HGW-Gammaproteobacteria-4]|nr:MAG: hybrid sensor histidine kinase/response regulator [Gammaproteobacteria bacterium HGW-Gammaproteobacteria-4]